MRSPPPPPIGRSMHDLPLIRVPATRPAPAASGPARRMPRSCPTLLTAYAAARPGDPPGPARCATRLRRLLAPPTHDPTLIRGSACRTTHLRQLRAYSTHAAHVPAWTADRLPPPQRSPALPQRHPVLPLPGPRSRSTPPAAYAIRALGNLPDPQTAPATSWRLDARPDSHPGPNRSTARLRYLGPCPCTSWSCSPLRAAYAATHPGAGDQPAAQPAIAADLPPYARPDTSEARPVARPAFATYGPARRTPRSC